MSGVLQGVDQRTQLVGHNRLELLLFRLAGGQCYGINVFKVREVLRCPKLNKLPNVHYSVCGVAHLRGDTVPIIDLQLAIGQGATQNHENCSVIVAEYNRTVQGFLVPKIEHIVNKNWQEILQPPKSAGQDHYVTAVTQIDNEIVEVLDVEKILYNITGLLDLNEGSGEHDVNLTKIAAQCHVLVADDSSVARNQIKRAISYIGVQLTMCRDGREALDTLQRWQAENAVALQNLVLVISDVEMPEMDGYTLTREIRSDPGLSHLTVLLHTSLSGVFDSSLLNDVQADGFLSKFDSDELASVVLDHVKMYAEKNNSVIQK